jgi:hypothetical protein
VAVVTVTFLECGSLKNLYLWEVAVKGGKNGRDFGLE